VRDRDQFQSSARGHPVFPAPFVREPIFPPTYVFNAFVKKQMTAAVWAYFWIVHSIPLVSVIGLGASTMPFLFLLLCAVICCQYCDSSSIMIHFLLGIAVGFGSLPCFHMNFATVCLVP
jgi:hypothetical protein